VSIKKRVTSIAAYNFMVNSEDVLCTKHYLSL